MQRLCEVAPYIHIHITYILFHVPTGLFMDIRINTVLFFIHCRALATYDGKDIILSETGSNYEDFLSELTGERTTRTLRKKDAIKAVDFI